MTATSDDTFCFVHAADLHLDTPFAGVHEAAPEVAAALREASLDAFDSIVSLALARGAAFLVVAGDVYDGPERGLRAQLRFRDGLARLAGEGIPSFVVHGNHDPVTTGWSAVASWPPGVTVFAPDAIAVVPVHRSGTQIATVQGISYATRATAENLSLRFARPDAPGVHVGVLHCNVAGAAEGYADYSPCTLDDLRRARLDYWALGHVHQQRVLARGHGPGDPWVVYAGNSQARSPRASERGPKGAVVVHVRAGAVERVEPVACDRVRFASLDCPIDDLTGLDELEERLVALGTGALAAEDGRSLVLGARITGRGPLHRDVARPGSLDELLRHLRDGARRDEPFCWWDRLTDASGSAVDLDEVRARGDFSADLVALAEALGSDAGTPGLVATEIAASVPRALAGDVASLAGDPGRFASLLDAATLLALDELAAGGP